jgi:hypothetical protein
LLASGRKSPAVLGAACEVDMVDIAAPVRFQHQEAIEAMKHVEIYTKAFCGYCARAKRV